MIFVLSILLSSLIAALLVGRTLAWCDGRHPEVRYLPDDVRPDFPGTDGPAIAEAN